jgi:hypothetical protein
MALAASVKSLRLGNREKLRRKNRHQGSSKLVSKVTPTQNIVLSYALFSGII